MSIPLGKRVEYLPYYLTDKQYFGEFIGHFEHSFLGEDSSLFEIKLDNGAIVCAREDQIKSLQ